MHYRYISSPTGQLLLAGDEHGLRVIGFAEGKGRIEPDALWQQRSHCFAQVETQLREYFNGRRRSFDLPLAPAGSEFQHAVLTAA